MQFGSLLKNARSVKLETGKGLVTQAMEILSLRMFAAKLGASEYYAFGAYEKQFSKSEREEFVGWRLEDEIDRKLNDDHWRAVSNDKLLFYSTLQAGGIPFPRIKAFFHPGGRHFAGAKCLGTVESVHKFLKNSDNLPVFIKPIHGSFGRGAVAVNEWRSVDEKIVLANGDCLSLDELLGERTYRFDAGYLFQELVHPHQQIREMCGPRLGTVRVIVMLDGNEAIIYRTVWKILTGKNMSDNFDSGRYGNMLADIEPETGRVKRVIGIRNGLPVNSTSHPDTGTELVGRVLPVWPQVRALCLSAATAYPGLRMQHWDIAIADEGPLALEANVQGSLDLPQLAARRGLLTDEFRAIVQRITHP